VAVGKLGQTVDNGEKEEFIQKIGPKIHGLTDQRQIRQKEEKRRLCQQRRRRKERL